MGGAVTAHGNITAAAEFNIAFDPEAAHIVFAAFPRIELADWEAVMAPRLRARDASSAGCRPTSPRARFYDAISRQHARLGRRPPRRRLAFGRRPGDGAAPCSRTGALEVAERPMAVELEGRHARGRHDRGLAPRGGPAGQRRASCCATTRPRFEALLDRRWRRLGRAGSRVQLPRLMRLAPGSAGRLECRSFPSQTRWQP